VWANGQSALCRKTGVVDVVEASIVLSLDYSSFDDYWSSFSTGPARIAQRFQALPLGCAEIERNVAAGYLAVSQSGPRPVAIIVRTVWGVIPG
jgi:hypothetical protein